MSRPILRHHDECSEFVPADPADEAWGRYDVEAALEEQLAGWFYVGVLENGRIRIPAPWEHFESITEATIPFARACVEVFESNGATEADKLRIVRGLHEPVVVSVDDLARLFYVRDNETVSDRVAALREAGR